MKTNLMRGAAFGALALAAVAQASAAAAQTETTTAEAVEEVVVLGRGQARQVQTVAGADLQLEAPGASPLKLVEKLPNVNLQTADPFGSYEWAARISIRSFNQGQLGFTLDDVPLGDMTYGNHNGLHISRAISSENVGGVELAQGAGSLEIASSSNLGGALKFSSRDPSRKFGGLVAGTYGSDETLRGFVRLESGELPGGLRGYLSYSNNKADKWKGDGEQKHQQVNFKAVQPLGAGSLTAFVNWSKRRENDYQDLSLEMIDRLGYDWDNMSGDWAGIVRISEIAHNRGETGVTPRNTSLGTVYPAPIKTADDAYYDAAGLRDDLLAALTFKMPVGENFDFKATVYHHQDEGQGLWGTPYVASPNYGVAGATTNDAPLSIRTTEYDLQRYGVVAGATWRVSSHTINGGMWWETNSFNQARRYYGLNRSAPQRDFLKLQRGSFRTDWEYDFGTTSWQFHIQDTWKINDVLTANFGFKSLSVENEAATISGANKTGTIKAKKTFLPQAGLVWDVNDGGQLFGSYAKTMRAFPSSGTSGPFSASQAGFLAIKDKLKPETADTFEAGYRLRRGGFQGLVALYHVKFKDRLFAVPVGAGIIGNPSALSNVSGVTATGVEAAANWRITDAWSLFASYAYNHSTFDEDTLDGDGKLVGRTDGKTTPDTPKHLIKADLAYDDGAWFAKASVSFLSRRYFTYENDRSVPSQTVAELAAGYRFHGSPLLEGLEVQLNVSNLFDKRYVSTINSNGFPLRGDSQTLLAAPGRQVFATVRKSF
jgi:iron complex outermembrane receptor protein